MNRVKNKTFLVSPSLLSSNLSRLRDEVQALEEARADWIHFDVMDGHFVPNLTFGAKVLEFIRPVTQLPLDVHLMIKNPEKYYNDFISAGADYLTLHVETLKGEREYSKKEEVKENDRIDKIDRIDRIDRTDRTGLMNGVREKEEVNQKGWIFEDIRKKGCKPGITLRPSTPVSRIFPFLRFVDLVLVMTVEPGFGGQVFMENQIPKIDAIDDYRRKFGLSHLISVDGGIHLDTASFCKKADVLVSGSYIFSAFLESDFKKQKSLEKDKRKDKKGGHFQDLKYSKEFLIQAYAKAIQSLKALK